VTGSTVGFVEPFNVPKQNAVGTLEKRLMEFGMGEAAAAAVAHAVDDPALFRRQLAMPARLRVPGGTLLMVSTRVSAAAVLPHLTNGRVVGSTPYPASGQDTQKFWAERDLNIHDEYVGQLVLNGSDSDAVAEAFRESYAALAAQNAWDESIKEGGVFSPITVVPMSIYFEDDTETTFLTAIDGSSRVASCHRILGIDADDIVFGNLANYRNARAWLRDHMSVLDHEFGDAPLDNVRAASLPANIVLGFEQLTAGSGDVKQALDSYVSLIHIESPRPWKDEAKENKIADAVIDVLLNQEEIDVPTGLWLAGYMTDDEARENDFSPLPDIRAAKFLDIMRTSSQTPLGYAVGSAIRRLKPEVGKAYPKHKAPIAAAMALRAEGAKSSRKPMMNVLARIYEKSLWSAVWSLTYREPDDLLQAALAAHEAGEEVGPDAVELGVLASYYLAANKLLLGPGPGTKGQIQVDKRWPDIMMNRLLREADGLRVLHAILVAGRANEDAWIRDEHGNIKTDGSGKRKGWDNVTIRQRFPEGEESPKSPAATPLIQMHQNLRIMREGIEVVVSSTDELGKLRDNNGDVLIRKIGIDKPMADQMLADLKSVTEQVSRYALIWELHHEDDDVEAAPDTEPEEDIDEDGDYGFDSDDD
jgi:hypothetical protein